ncbi:FAD-binding protein [Pseudophaeobacter sp.]|uniref:FAD-binding protein n=1 Tax=Pseudophaeobacter sp. TaxID=1971739 RepID=UPI004058E7C6
MKMHRPANEAELAELVAGTHTGLCVEGGGTRGLTVPGEILSTRGLSGVELYEPGSLTLVVKAGTPLAEVEALLMSEGQRLAFEPMDHRRLLGTKGAPTIGGVFAANISGPRRIQAGAARDFLLGVRFVDGRGAVVKNGGRVMKNVTGYDLVKLMAGAHGTLGVLSEVSLKVLPQAEASATVVVEGLSLDRAIQAMSAALGSPYDVTGAAYDPQAQAVFVRVEGFAQSVAYRGDKLVQELAQFGNPSLAREGAALWADIRDVTAFASHSAVWQASVKPTEAPELLDRLGQIHGFAYRLDWGGGRIWLALSEDELKAAAFDTEDGRRDDPLEGLAVFDANLRQNVAQLGGHVTLVKAPKEAALPRFQAQLVPLAAIAEGLRRQFDPRGILNPGLMG